jgi:hypothetical protein
LGAVLAGQRGLNRKGFRLRRNPPMEPEAAASVSSRRFLSTGTQRFLFSSCSKKPRRRRTGNQCARAAAAGGILLSERGRSRAGWLPRQPGRGAVRRARNWRRTGGKVRGGRVEALASGRGSRKGRESVVCLFRGVPLQLLHKKLGH